MSKEVHIETPAEVFPPTECLCVMIISPKMVTKMNQGIYLQLTIYSERFSNKPVRADVVYRLFFKDIY